MAGEGDDQPHVAVKSGDEDAAVRNRRKNFYMFVVLAILVAASVTVLIVVFITAPANRLKQNIPGRKFTYAKECPQNLKWWQTSIIYQVYPRSFKDSNGDGVGDLKGLEEKLDHFDFIHVGAVWLSPMFKSPMKDFGYDVSNYTDVDPIFGNMADFDSLLKRMQEKKLKLILDFVPNHSSDQHPWFIESRSSRTNPKRDWYMWADPLRYDNGKPVPPNNWVSVFSGSMWEFDNTTNQFYLHQFLKEQPDLNYSNPDVRQASKDVLKFWLDKGVDGFRIDAIKHVYENPKLTNEPLNPSFRPGIDEEYLKFIHNETTDYGDLHALNRMWRVLFDQYKDKPRFAVGEAYDPIDIIMLYYGNETTPEFHFPFNFFLLTLSEWNGTSLHDTVHDWMSKMPKCGWPNWVVGNHDNKRIYTRRQAKYVRAVNAVNLLLPGTPTTYYGEEIDMSNVYIPYEDAQDPFGINNPEVYDKVTRDPERTPMQWDSSANAGFTTENTKPWLPIASNYTKVNVEIQKTDTKSALYFYRDLATLRREEAFKYPNYQSIGPDKDLFAFIRFSDTDSKAYLVMANLGKVVITRDLSHISDISIIALSSVDRNNVGQMVRLHEVKLEVGEVLVVWINNPHDQQ